MSEGMAREWRKFSLDQLGRIVTGKTPPSSIIDAFDGNLPFVTPSDMDGSRIISVTARKLSISGKNAVKNAVVPKNAVMVSCIGSDMGKAAIAGAECVTNQQINSIVVDTENSPLFVYYNLSLRKAEIRGSASGSAQPILNKSAFGRLDIELPPIEEQRAISHILGTLDDKIELNRKQNETLEAMARALFKAWFVDFEPVRAKMEGRWQRGQSLPGLPAHLYDLFPDRLVDSELGEIPEGWEIQSVQDIGEIICGKTPSTKVFEYYGDDIPFITIPEMHGNIFAIDIKRRLSHAGANSQQNKMLPQGAICVSCIATLGLVVITTEPSQTNQQINSVVPSEKGTTYYWYWVLKNLGDEIKAGGSGGSVLGNLSTSRFAELKVTASTEKLRLAYHAMVEALFSGIMENTRESRSLAQLRDTLLPKLISGELRVTDCDRVLEDGYNTRSFT